ncbi:MAG: hypothetical protein VX899_22480 [Myxococcota bacterium]|nr:hypothetical protein [Myxococcota bacterium]
MSTKTDKSAPAASTKEAAASAKAEDAKKAASAKDTKSAGEKAKAPSAKVHIVWDSAGKGDADATAANCREAGFEVTMARVSPLANYMKHEDRVYVPENLDGKADDAIAAVRSVRTQMTLHPTAEDDTIYAWIIR